MDSTSGTGRVIAQYPPPRGNVVLLTCMDLRVMDELAALMHRDNLTNRYDHLIFAGAALGVMHDKNSSWRKVFFDHLDIAMQLHAPQDVYIVEHRNCGAYQKFLKQTFNDSVGDQDNEREAHRLQAAALTGAIQDWCKKKSTSRKKITLNVRSFLMDLRGNVDLLDYTEG